MPAFITFEDTISHVVNKDKTSRCHYIMVYILVLTDIINQWFTADYVSWDHEQPRLQDDNLKSLEMKLSCKYQWGSFLDHQDGWCIANKERRITLRHAAGWQRQVRRNLSLHLQWTPTSQSRISKNQERLTGEEDAIVRILRIRWCKEKLNARESSMDLKTMTPRRQCRVA